MNVNPKPLRFPVLKFLNQRVFDPKHHCYLLPNRYWHFYQRQHLETCWVMEYESERGSRNS